MIAQRKYRSRRWWSPGWRSPFAGDVGMSTAEYAIGTIAAAAFAGVLYLVLTGDTITDGVKALVERALSFVA
ncbi:DUF4244 domain-containing protein [Amycolatopsis anabasis]|uniref:DUF4244 domain-containing protein n=1 Tax=Amycolatopsis anabasis TaxID=1840409 RepID=UPI00131EB155|nr:DUF4244 domain-containing protein [Amycolatopsis anabasis]